MYYAKLIQRESERERERGREAGREGESEGERNKETEQLITNLRTCSTLPGPYISPSSRILLTGLFGLLQ